MVLNITQCARQLASPQNHLAQNVSHAEAE
jgi:hypothetical protein